MDFRQRRVDALLYLSSGLDLVPNTAASGVTGLLGLTGQAVGGTVNLYATSYTIGDIDQGYLYGITDLLGATSRPAGETFSTLAAAPSDSTFKGVAFAPSAVAAVLAPATWATIILGVGLAGGTLRRRSRPGSARRVLARFRRAASPPSTVTDPVRPRRATVALPA